MGLHSAAGLDGHVSRWQTTGVPRLLLVLALALGPPIAASSAIAGPRVAAQVESETPTPISVPAPDDAGGERPKGNEWIVGVVVFVLAAALIVTGRWWVRNRVGRVNH